VACVPLARAAALAACASVLALSAPARAEPIPQRGGFAPEAPPRDPPYLAAPVVGDYVIVGAGGAIALGNAIASPQPKHWRGGVLFDESVRDALRIGSIDGRYKVRDASDVGLSLEVTWPFLVDGLITAWYADKDPELARRMVLVDAEALAIVAAVQETATTVASRERPYGRDCGTDIPDKSVDCDSNARYRSFFSGHSGLSFTSASLVCVHHLKADLLGGPWDALSCVGGYAVAATTATFRIMGDMHYATDVITGALVGTAVGLGIPLLHSKPSDRETVSGAGAVRIDIIPVAAGLGIGGIF